MPIMIFMTRYYNISRHTRRIVSDSQHLFKFILPAVIVAVIVFTSSCEKGILKIGTDILPNSDFVSIKSVDTLSVYSYTMYNDSIRTDNPIYSYIGQAFDPYFGTTTAGFVTQIRLGEKWDGLPFTVDSMKLYLHLLTANGGSNLVHSISIYEIANQIYTDSAYYANSAVPVTNFKMENIDLPALRTDTINDIEITLPGNGLEFGKYITRDTMKLFYNNNIPDFRSYFKGLYFVMNPSSEPLLVSLSLVFDQQSHYNFFLLYGHDDSGTFKEYSFILDAKNTNAAFNKFSHDYTTATEGDKMEHRNTSYKDTLSYLQSLNGVYTKLVLPGLEDIKKDPSLDKIAVNKARLVVPVYFHQTATDQYISKIFPLNLRLRYKANTGLRYDVPDYTMALASDPYHYFFNGSLDTIAKVYNFNIPGFVQAYLRDSTGVVGPELEIFQTSGTRNAILKANNSKTPIKFEFTYSEF